jgi:hypothetical protein
MGVQGAKPYKRELKGVQGAKSPAGVWGVPSQLLSPLGLPPQAASYEWISVLKALTQRNIGNNINTVTQWHRHSGEK